MHVESKALFYYMPKKLTTEEFFRRARLVHGDKYDYSKVEYKNNSTKVCIICPIHGEFWQTPHEHLNGCGCQECGKITQRTRKTFTQEEFIRRSRLIHGDKYDYSKVIYKKANIKVCIICPIHGEFWQTPVSHMLGHGCSKCGAEYRGRNNTLSTEDFIQKAIEVHGNKYGYGLVDYKGGKIKVPIICPKHGVFWQIPNSHMMGRGCPLCYKSFGESSIKTWLEQQNITYIQQYRLRDMLQSLFGRNLVRVDFYLPNYNTIIEYNGRQHYIRQPNWHTEEQFEEQQDRDRRLREYCKQHKIRLIEIPYTEFDNIDKILTRKLLKSKKK